MASNKGGKMQWIIGCESPQEECLTESLFENTILSPPNNNNNNHDNNNINNNENGNKINNNNENKNDDNNYGKIRFKNKDKAYKNSNHEKTFPVFIIVSPDVSGEDDEDVDVNIISNNNTPINNIHNNNVPSNNIPSNNIPNNNIPNNNIPSNNIPNNNIPRNKNSSTSNSNTTITPLTTTPTTTTPIPITSPTTTSTTTTSTTTTSTTTTSTTTTSTTIPSTTTASKARALLSYILGGRHYGEMDRHTYWTHLFHTYFLNDPCLADDLIFYVKIAYAFKMPMPEVEVYRSSSTNQPSLDNMDVQWEETVYLNFILHHLDYYVTCAVCTRTGERELQILKKSTCKVYASPSHRSLEYKGDTEQITYPHIYFTVDNYDEVFSDIQLQDTELICTELVAKDKKQEQLSVLFLGCIRYRHLKNAFEIKNNNSSNNNSTSNLSNKYGSNSSLKMISSWFKDDSKLEYISMKGPGCKGLAEVAVSMEKELSSSSPSSSFLTPSLENLYKTGFHGGKKGGGCGGCGNGGGGGGGCGNGGGGKGLYASASETGMGHRQMSDPNMSVSYYCGSGGYGGSGYGGGGSGGSGGSGGGFHRNRSRSENEKVDGGGAREEVVCSYLQEELEEKLKVYPNICDFNNTYNQKFTNKKSKSPSKKTTPKRKNSTPTTPPTIIHKATRDKKIATNYSIYNNNINYNKNTNNNTSIYGSRWFEQRKQQKQHSRKLSAYLTYISLPWHQIIADLLEQRQKPVISHSYS